MSETTRSRRRRRRRASDVGGPAAELRSRPRLAILRGVGLIAFRFLLPVALLVAVAVGIGYVRLLNGPISLPFLLDPIARGINAELNDFKVSIGEAVVELRASSFEFRLKNVRMDNVSGQTVAIAPLASLEVSQRAFFRGQISPSRIVLIEPQLRAFYSSESGLSLSIDPNAVRTESAPQGTGGRVVGRRDSLRTVQGGSETRDRQGQTAGRIDLARTIAFLAERARGRLGKPSFLERVGLRNASLFVDQAGVRTVIQVPVADFDLRQVDGRSILNGKVTLATARGNWHMGLSAEEPRDADTVRLTTTIRDLSPETLAEIIPGFSDLASLKLPVSGQSDLVLSRSGDVLQADFDIRLGRGRIALPGFADLSPSLESGVVNLRYNRGQNRLQVLPSTLQWSGSRITVAGHLSPQSAGQSSGVWDFELRSTNGLLSTIKRAAKINLDQWTASGSVVPAEGLIKVERAIAKVGGGELTLQAAARLGQSPELAISGRLGSMGAANFFGFWPTFVAPDARLWTSRNLLAGQVNGGEFSVRLARGRASSLTGGADATTHFSQSLKLDLGDARFLVDRSLPPVFAEQASVSLENEKLSVDIPAAAFVVSGDHSLRIDGLRLVAADVFDPVVDGETVFRVKGNVGDGLDMAARLGAVDVAGAAALAKRVTGRIDGNFNLTVPISRPDALPPVSVTGQVRILDGEMRKVWRNHDIRGSKLVLDIDRTALSAKGQLLVSGVPVGLRWQGTMGAAPARQPPMRLTATLDDAERRQLGLQINHLVQGPMDVDVILKVDAGSGQSASTHVSVDLTKSDATIESLAWRKPIGRRANVEFDVVPLPGGTARLSNIRVEGHNIAVRGQGRLDADGRLRSFDFPEFSIDVVTRLQVKGELQKGNVWRVSAQGATYEGRELFRTLFSASRLKGRPSPKSEAGLDLDVRISSVLGFWQTNLRNVRLDLSKRKGKIVSLKASGKLRNNKSLTATISRKNGRRVLQSKSDDAGQALTLIGFYPNVRGGSLDVVVDMDGAGSVDRIGRLMVRKFRILGDPILSEVVQSQAGGPARRKRWRRDAERQVLEFDWMRLPFEAGRGQFLVTDAELRGPVHGVLLCGRANFAKRGINLAGTYVPLQGLSAAVGVIPGLGQLLAGPKGAGIFGVNFQISGAMEQPQVLLNPLSLATPGIFREVFQAACPKSTALKTTSGGSKSRRRGTEKDWTKAPFSN